MPNKKTMDRQREYRFLNPYNFVRWLGESQKLESHPDTKLLGKVEPPPHDRWVGLTGEIACEITTRSPLFVSDSRFWYANAEDEKQLHKSFGFFKLDFGNGPESVIPASSLRGMIRNVFEAATNSCFAGFDYGQRLSYRLPPHEALKLVPARVVHDTKSGQWHLQLMHGTATLAIAEKPRGGLYPATVKRYEPLPQEVSYGKRTSRKGPREKAVDIGGFKHGDECYALAEKGRFVWKVKSLAGSSRDLLSDLEGDQQILKGYLCITNQNIENKSKERFFISEHANGSSVKDIALPRQVRNDYEQLIKDYQERHRSDVEKWQTFGRDPNKPRDVSKPWQIKRPRGKTIWHPAYSRFILEQNPTLKHGDLVYASLTRTADGPRVEFIAPVSIPRVNYKNKSYLRLPAHLWKCEDAENLCPACRTFGWVEGRPGEEEEKQGKKKTKQISAYRGRVRLTHARLSVATNGALSQHTTLAILSSPKPTTSRFYLMPAKAKPESKQGASDLEVGYDAPDMVIRGRKMYRRHHRVDANEYKRAGGIRDDQNRTIQDALPENSSFKFTLRFENLAAVELGALLWALELDEGMCHRLGFAKPFGFGSVQIRVQEIRMLSQGRFTSLLAPRWQNVTSQKDELVSRFKATLAHAHFLAGESDFDKLENIADLKALLSESQPERPVHYPRSSKIPDIDGKNFEWFMGNKRHKRGPGYLLPLAVDDTTGFPLIDKFGAERKG